MLIIIEYTLIMLCNAIFHFSDGMSRCGGGCHPIKSPLRTRHCPLFFGIDSRNKKLWVNELEAHRPYRISAKSRVLGLAKTQKAKNIYFYLY